MPGCKGAAAVESLHRRCKRFDCQRGQWASGRRCVRSPDRRVPRRRRRLSLRSCWDHLYRPTSRPRRDLGRRLQWRQSSRRCSGADDIATDDNARMTSVMPISGHIAHLPPDAHCNDKILNLSFTADPSSTCQRMCAFELRFESRKRYTLHVVDPSAFANMSVIRTTVRDAR